MRAITWLPAVCWCKAVRVWRGQRVLWLRQVRTQVCVHRCVRIVCHAYDCVECVRYVCHTCRCAYRGVHRHGAVPTGAVCRVSAVPVPCPHRRCRSPRPPCCGSLRARAHLRTRGDPRAHEPPSPPSLSPPPGPGATPEAPSHPEHPARVSLGSGGAAPPAPSHPAAALECPRLDPGVGGAEDSWRGPGDSRGAPGWSPGRRSPRQLLPRAGAGGTARPGAGSSWGVRGWGHPEPPRQLQRGAGDAPPSGAGGKPTGGHLGEDSDRCLRHRPPRPPALPSPCLSHSGAGAGRRNGGRLEAAAARGPGCIVQGNRGTEAGTAGATSNRGLPLAARTSAWSRVGVGLGLCGALHPARCWRETEARQLGQPTAEGTASAPSAAGLNGPGCGPGPARLRVRGPPTLA